MSISGRLAAAIGLFAGAVALVLWAVFGFITPNTPVTDFTTAQPAGSPVNVHVQVVGAIGYGPHPTWVSYLVQTPGGSWTQSTDWKLPQHSLVNMTVDEYDSGSPLRNQVWGQIEGTQGGSIAVDGQATSVVDSYAGNGVAHTFAVPSLGIVVPFPAVNGSAKNFCSSAAPCATSTAHNVIKFSFMTPGPGNYQWQCFVPCGLSTLFGNGGPMSTVGYMGGFLEVTA